jgi:hypothetical protein
LFFYLFLTRRNPVWHHGFARGSKKERCRIGAEPEHSMPRGMPFRTKKLIFIEIGALKAPSKDMHP